MSEESEEYGYQMDLYFFDSSALVVSSFDHVSINDDGYRRKIESHKFCFNIFSIRLCECADLPPSHYPSKRAGIEINLREKHSIYLSPSQVL
jgi:hypothetical protein